MVTLCHPALNGSLSGEINPILHCFDSHPYICSPKTKNQLNTKGGSLLKPSFKINSITQFHVLDTFLSSKHCSMLTLSKLMIMCHTFVSLSIVAQSGDVHPNPGPRTKYPCGVCSKACKWNQNCIVCDNCETWLHKQCIGINIFNQLANSSCTWICDDCGLPQFSSSLFESSLPTSNYFEALADNSDLESEPSSPLMASSPVPTSRSNNHPSRSQRRVNSPDSHRRRRNQSSVDMEVHGLRLMILNLQGILNKTQSFADKLLKHNSHIVLASDMVVS